MSHGQFMIISVTFLIVSGCCSEIQRRQVVQPLWLMRPQLPQAGRVRVTPENLKETAVIRATIQKAVNEDTYVVAQSPQQFLGQMNMPGALGAQLPMPMLPAFLLPNATWWRARLFFA